MDKQEKLLKAIEDAQLLNSDKIAEILEESRSSDAGIEDILEKIIDPEELTKVKAKIYDLPYTTLLEKKVKEEILNIIPSQVAENYQIVCFEKNADKIKVGLVDPENFKAVEAIDFLAKESELKAEYYLVSKQSFRAIFKQYQSLSKELSSALKTREQESAGEEDKEDNIKLEEVTKSAPVAKIVSVIIRHAVEGDASDIHIEPLKKESRVRYRIDGILYTTLVLPRNVHRAIVARIKVMANLKLDETRVPQDGRFKLYINDRGIDFRVSVLPLVGTEKVVMRILDTSKGAPKLDVLGYQGVQLKVIKNNIRKTEGLMLVTGPTGSGKSTTLFAILDQLNKEGVNISTLEDPVEYQIMGVNQSQVRPEIHYTFANGLRSLLRQDPDVIMVGEIRDNETAELAIHASLTGHSVLSTLHTTNAPSAIARLIDMKIEPFLIGTTLHTVIAQRLVRKNCQHCIEKIKLPAEYLEDIKAEIEKITVDYLKTIIKNFDPNNLIFYKSKGCPRCGNSGYSGRTTIAEVLDINYELREMIKEGKKYLANKDILANQKFINVKQDGIIKILQGVTTMEEILRVCKD